MCIYGYYSIFSRSYNQNVYITVPLGGSILCVIYCMGSRAFSFHYFIKPFSNPVFLSFFLFLPRSFSFSLSISISLSLTLTLPLSLTLSLFISLSRSLSLAIVSNFFFILFVCLQRNVCARIWAFKCTRFSLSYSSLGWIWRRLLHSFVVCVCIPITKQIIYWC